MLMSTPVWMQWLWTVASGVVLIDTPIGIYMYHRYIKKMKFSSNER